MTSIIDSSFQDPISVVVSMTARYTKDWMPVITKETIMAAGHDAQERFKDMENVKAFSEEIFSSMEEENPELLDFMHYMKDSTDAFSAMLERLPSCCAGKLAGMIWASAMVQMYDLIKRQMSANQLEAQFGMASEDTV